METKSIQNDNIDSELNDEEEKEDRLEDGPNIAMGVKEVVVKDFKEMPSLVETKKKGRLQKKMEIESSDDESERVDYNHKFPNINPRCCIT